MIIHRLLLAVTTSIALLVNSCGDREKSETPIEIPATAMTDPGIEEIYTLCDAALRSGQKFFRVHIFPFRMTDENLAARADHRWHDFWQNLREGHDAFEKSRIPPDAHVTDEGKYQFR